MGLDIRWVGGRSDGPLYHHYVAQESHFQFCLVSSFVEIYVLTLDTTLCSPKEKKEGKSAGDDEDEPRKLSHYSRINPAFEYQN